MSRYLVTTSIIQGGSVAYPKGAMVELSSAQVTALGAANFRLANNPGTPVTTTYTGGATSSAGVQTGSQTHDTLGMAAGVSN
jgi:hypothetical protein